MPDRIVRITTTPDGELDELVTTGHAHLERLDEHELYLVMGTVGILLSSESPIRAVPWTVEDWSEIVVGVAVEADPPAHPARMAQPDEEIAL